MSMLLEQFDTILDTSASVEKLKELILDMSVKGKLVSQDLDDEPASVLLERIKEEKELLIKEKKIKKQKLLSETKEEEMLYELPKGWKWVRLGDLVLEILGGGTPSKSNPAYWNGDIPWASVKDIKELYITSTQDTITPEGLANSSAKLITKQNIILCTRMGLGKICINTIDMAINQDLKAVYLPKTVDKLYFVYWYKSLKIEGTGTTVKGIRQDQLLNLSFPFPPLNEQRRIVKRVDQLMSFCEELKKRLEKKRERGGRLNVSAFSSLEQSLTPEALKENLQFVLTNLSSLCTEEKHIQQLRNAIVSLAVKGKLVPQDKNDEPASALLEKVKEEKERLIKEKIIKREKSILPIVVEEKAYGLPKGWEWTRLGTIIHLISGQHLTPDQYNIKGKGIPYLTGPSDFQNGRALITKWTEVPKVVVEKNDILITVKGSGVGKAIILNVSSTSIGRQLMAIRPVLIDKNYVYMFIQLYKKRINDASIGIAIPGISREDLLNLMIPLPPLDEQKRIVEKVSQLMSLCSELEKQINCTNNQKEQLLQSILNQAFQQ